MTTTASVGINHSIAKQIFKVVFAIYFFVTLVVTTVHMLSEYGSHKNYVLADLTLMYQTLEPEIAQTIWDSDWNQLQSFLKGMVEHPSLLGIKIIALDGQLLGGAGTVVNEKGQSVSIKEQNREVFERKVMGIFSQEQELVYKNTEGETVNLGNVILYSNSRIVLLRVRSGFITILVNAVIKTLALWLIFLTVSHFWLNRPFSQAIQAIEELDLENPNKMEIELPTRERNEFKILEDAFNQKVLKLAESHQELLEIKKTVENKPQEQTP